MVKSLPANAGDAGDSGLTHGARRSPGVGNGNSNIFFFKMLQYSCLGSSLDIGAWWAAVPGVTKSQTELSD